MVGERVPKSKAWPETPRGNRLRRGRHLPAEGGIDIAFKKEGRARSGPLPLLLFLARGGGNLRPHRPQI